MLNTSMSILIKPASSSCNLKCKYCFYNDVADNREVINYGIMNIDTADTIIKKAFDENTESIFFMFQGGEPTIAGLDFFEKFISIVKKYNINKTKVNFSLQTNGTLLNEEWAKFLKANNFLVGISLDGPKDIHDQLRLSSSYKGSYKEVIKSIKLLKKYNVPFNILCVLTSYNAKHIRKVYNFFKNERFTHLQFIPCMEPLCTNKTINKYSLKNSDYRYALNTLFDLYKKDFFNNEYTSIRLFDNYIYMCLGYPPENCGLSGTCSCYYVIESNGDVFPCDFYAIDKYKLGNILESSFTQMSKSNASREFIKESTLLEQKCLNCEYINLCRGGCKRYRSTLGPSSLPINYFCDAYYDFFNKNIYDIIEISKKISMVEKDLK